MTINEGQVVTNTLVRSGWNITTILLLLILQAIYNEQQKSTSFGESKFFKELIPLSLGTCMPKFMVLCPTTLELQQNSEIKTLS